MTERKGKRATRDFIAGDVVWVWMGALAASPGIPGPDAKYIAGRVTRVNEIGQCYVEPARGEDTWTSLFVWPTALKGRAPGSFIYERPRR